jgi:acyl-CoA synthetase (AMP-forming)/AMP-acid ligase II
MNFFWIDSKRNLEVTYDSFFNKLIEENKNNIYIKNENPYLVFLNLLRNFISGKRSIILDANFSNEELLKLEITDNFFKKGGYIQPNLSNKFKSLQEIFSFLNANKENLELDIYTSGTTGRPKIVTQSFENLIRAVKERDSLQDNVWGFAYNPTHFAGLQVFFQAFYNTNTLVYIFNKDFKEVYKDFLDYEITHLSCTPTFMKMLLPYVNNSENSIVSLTFGGEKFDTKIEKKLKDKFPNALIKNVYASTEAGSLLKSEGECFTIPKRYHEFIKIENFELVIHKKLLGASKFFDLDGVWYKTGDIVELYDGGKFKFKNRKSEMINVGGYKVNPSEIEAIIKGIEGVADVIVFGRKNSVMGEIVVANVIKEEKQEKQELKARIKTVITAQLQEYKLPRLIKFVDSFELTRTGKVKKQ